MTKLHYFLIVGVSDAQTTHNYYIGGSSRNVNKDDLELANKLLLEQAKDFNNAVTGVVVTNIVYLGEMTEEEWFATPDKEKGDD